MIGGGVTGCSVAYHLAAAGLSDVLLVDKDELTSGSTCHAAGLVTQFNPSPTMMGFRRYSVEFYNQLGVFEPIGSLRIASTPESLVELRRGASRARGIGLDVEVIGPQEAVALMPAASPDSLYGAVWIARRRLRRPAHRHLCAGQRRPRAGRGRAHPHPCDRDRAWPGSPRPGRAHRCGPHRDGAGGERLRYVGAAGGRDGGRVRAVGAGRPPAHRAACGRRSRAAARHAVLPRHRQPRLRPVRGGRRPVRRLRAQPGRPLGRRGAVGPRRPGAPGRSRPVRAADGGGRRGASRSSTTPASSRWCATPTR